MVINWNDAPEWATEIRKHCYGLCWSDGTQYKYIECLSGSKQILPYDKPSTCALSDTSFVEQRPVSRSIPVGQADWEMVPKNYNVFLRNKLDGISYVYAEKHITGSSVIDADMKYEPFTLSAPLWELIETRPLGKVPTAFDGQVGGTHYTDLAMQPLELAYVNLGYKAFCGACFVKVNKYTTRKKDNEVVQLKKARHILDLWIEKAEIEQGK